MSAGTFRAELHDVIGNDEHAVAIEPAPSSVLS